MQAALPRIIPTAGEAFAASIDGRSYTKRAEAVAAISEWIRTHTPEYGNYYRQKQDYGTMVSLGGHELQVRNAAEDSRLGSYQDLAITLKDVPAPALVFTRMELLEGNAGIITRLENKVSGLPDYEAQLRQTIIEKQAVLSDVESQAGKPFKYEDKLVAARARCAELDEKLQASIDPPKPPPSAEVSVTEVRTSSPTRRTSALRKSEGDFDSRPCTRESRRHRLTQVGGGTRRRLERNRLSGLDRCRNLLEAWRMAVRHVRNSQDLWIGVPRSSSRPPCC